MQNLGSVPLNLNPTPRMNRRHPDDEPPFIERDPAQAPEAALLHIGGGKELEIVGGARSSQSGQDVLS